MTRSLKIREDRIEKIKLSLKQNRIPNQKVLAAEVELAVSTVSNFLNGRPVDFTSFQLICERLNVDWQAQADWGDPIDGEALPSAAPALEITSGFPFYVERPPIEERCWAAIKQPHSLIRIKSPHQMGKTALIDRILERSTIAASEGNIPATYRQVKINFQSADEAVFTDLDKFLMWFCNKVSRKLQLNCIAQDFWSDLFGSKDNCTTFFEEQVLPTADTPLILGLDDVDLVFKYPAVAADFLGLLRSWYEESAVGEWSKLRIVIAHATEVYIPLHSDQSPFNVGLPIELSEFTPAQVQILVDRHQLPWTTAQIEELMTMVGGHPYLVSLALDHIHQHQISLTDFWTTAPTEAPPYGDHLRSLWNKIKSQPALLAAVATLMQASTAIEIEPELSFQLCSMGLAIRQGNQIAPRCQLYRRYFASRGNL